MNIMHIVKDIILKIKIAKDQETLDNINISVEHRDEFYEPISEYECITLYNKKELQKLDIAIQQYLDSDEMKTEVEFKYSQKNLMNKKQFLDYLSFVSRMYIYNNCLPDHNKVQTSKMERALNTAAYLFDNLKVNDETHDA